MKHNTHTGDGHSVKLSLQCQRLRITDAFGNLRTHLFCIGMFHFVWYTLKINFHLMWHFGFGELAKTLKKSKVTKEATKFANSDAFLHLIWIGTCNGVVLCQYSVLGEH